MHRQAGVEEEAHIKLEYTCQVAQVLSACPVMGGGRGGRDEKGR